MSDSSIQSYHDASKDDRAWLVRGSVVVVRGDGYYVRTRAPFKHLAREAVIALGKFFKNPAESEDFWIEQVYRFHSDEKTELCPVDDWRLEQLREASAEYCRELYRRAGEARNPEAAKTWADFERRFRELQDSKEKPLCAIRRREFRPIPLPPDGGQVSIPNAAAVPKSGTGADLNLKQQDAAVPRATADSREEVLAERRRLRTECGSAHKAAYGTRITDEEIARRANPKWKSRYPIQKWLAGDPKFDGEPDRLIRKALSELTEEAHNQKAQPHQK